MQQKVLAYICRFEEGLWQLLVFQNESQLNDPNLDPSGIQVPCGSAETGESLQGAVENEVHKSTGLQDLMVLSKIDEYQHTDSKTLDTVERHAFLLLAPQELPAKWTHSKNHFTWVPAAAARKKLVEAQDRSIKNLVQFLFQRDSLKDSYENKG